MVTVNYLIGQISFYRSNRACVNPADSYAFFPPLLLTTGLWYNYTIALSSSNAAACRIDLESRLMSSLVSGRSLIIKRTNELFQTSQEFILFTISHATVPVKVCSICILYRFSLRSTYMQGVLFSSFKNTNLLSSPSFTRIYAYDTFNRTVVRVFKRTTFSFIILQAAKWRDEIGTPRVSKVENDRIS